ncbi:MAG TPA: hypothetical protein VFY68_02865, partial [Nitrososphaeraceae archaeon]|nr:hypothetical protein [Nitrososphaeraceae archaeon]
MVIKTEISTPCIKGDLGFFRAKQLSRQTLAINMTESVKIIANSSMTASLHTTSLGTKSPSLNTKHELYLFA